MRHLTIFTAAVALCLFTTPFDVLAAEEGKTEKVSVFGEGELTVPAEFKRVPPKSRILEHEFAVKEGDQEDAPTARLTMMAAGGDVQANISRWHGQFAGGDKDAQKAEAMEVGQWKVHLVDASGTYAERMGGGPFAGGKVVNREDYAMVGAILVHPTGRKYFVKMIGPQKVVKPNRKAFVELVKSIDE